MPPMGIGVVGVKPMVMGTDAFPDMRSDDKAMTNETAVTCPSIDPDAAAAEAALSVEV